MLQNRSMHSVPIVVPIVDLPRGPAASRESFAEFPFATGLEHMLIVH
jgi:hypothetical protein